ncbi:AmmeMemoRadiSam system protein B [candidate division KSB1 bacterium]|nr:AmmeMemoRadiSam system protein B [candidate division KSB1 bacterium]
MSEQQIRKSVIAGTWYPADANELRKEIRELLDLARPVKIPGNIIALISPHAGYAYSGPTAAMSYRQIKGQSYDAVIIIAPSHREAFQGASVYTGDAYETPLGLVPVEKTIANALVQIDPVIRSSMDGHREEHALEIHLPFLQETLKDLKIVPIVMWDYSLENCQKLAAGITKAVQGRNVLLIASTDLYHGYSQEECEATNDRTIKNMLKLEPEQLCERFQKQELQACGAGPVIVVEMVAKSLGADATKLLQRTNSNEVTGKDGGYVVGYASIAIYTKSSDMQTIDKASKVGVDMGLSDDDKATLLTIARQAIECAVSGKSAPKLTVSSPILNEQRGGFVTLTKHSQLRGCIGYIQAVKPLAETIQEMAQAAATRDPRFTPVKKNEVDDLHIEISVLTPIREISDVNEIEVGKHGIIIERGMRSGLLLPQVATEYGWDRTTFLQHTCQKAGLPMDAWQQKDTVIKIFSADIFEEEE